MRLKRILALALVAVMMMSTCALAAPEGWTPDMGARDPQSPWYAEAVDYVMDKGLMQGTDNGFDPTGIVTRGTVFQTLYNMEGRPEVTNKMATFPDAQGKWYENAARWAEQMGLTTGTDVGFEGEKAMTRAEIVTVLVRHALTKDEATPTFEGEGEDLSGYADVDQVPDWARTGFSWACNSVISGKDGNRLAPNDVATRAELAKMLTSYIAYTGIEPATQEKPVDGALTGKAASVSKYGNVTTDIKMEDVTAAGFEVGDILKVEITNQEPLMIPYGTGYSNVDQGKEIALADTDAGTLAIAINRGDFASTYGIAAKDENKVYTIDPAVTITVSMGEKGGYLSEMEIRELDSKRTNVREDYASDEVFANFRPIVMGSIAEGNLYRTSSPVNPELGRNTYADQLIEKHGVKTIVNLADCVNTIKEYEGFNDTYYAQQKYVCLNMGVDMYSDESIGDLKNGLEFMVENPGPYAFHCTEGKDRAGYFAMLLEALMGAKTQEIVTDYMLSFENYYHIANRTEQWMKIAESNIEKDIIKLAGVESMADLDGVDISKAAEKYIIETIGLTETQVNTLKTNLSTPIVKG